MKRIIQLVNKLAFVSLLMLPLISLRAQSYDLVSHMSGTEDVRAYGVASDDYGNVYTVGYFYGTVDFDPGVGTHELTSAGNRDIFITKVDATGSLVWATKFGGESNDFAYSIAMTNNDKFYVTGYFRDSVDFDPGEGESWLATNNGTTDLFLVKYDLDGNFLWANAFNGTSIGFHVSVDDANAAYVTGYFDGTTDFDFSLETTELTSFGSRDAFVAKYDQTGAFQWVSQLGGTSQDRGFATTVTTDGSVYVAGFYEGTADFDPGAGNEDLTSNGGRDMFVTKLDANGDLVWARSIGGAGEDQAKSIVKDQYGNVYITGFFEQTVDFDPGVGVSDISSAGGRDIFLMKLDANGDLVWANGYGSTGGDFTHTVTADHTGYIYMAGLFEGSIDFDPDVTESTTLTSSGGQESFEAKYDRDGNLMWAIGYGGSGLDIVRSIDVDADGDVYAAGFFQGAAHDFDFSASVDQLTSAGSYDAFTHKLSHVIQTDLVESACGYQVGSFDEFFGAEIVTGATNYMFEFTNTSTEAVTTYETGSADPSASLLLANLYDVAIDYDVRVRAQVSGVWGEYGHTCTLTAPAQPDATNLRSIDCGITVQQLSTAFYAKVIPNAEDYEFEFTNTSTMAVTELTTGSSSNEMSLSTAGLNTYGVTYDVRVRAQVTGVWGEYGTICQITSPAQPYVPVTRVRGLDCNTQVADLTSTFLARAVANATNYEFEFTNTSTMAVTEVTTGSSSRSMSLNAAGLTTLGVTYDVRVRAEVNSTFGQYDLVCQISAPAADVPNTKVRGYDCNVGTFGLSETFSARNVVDATNYEFEFTNTNTLAVTEVFTGSSSRNMTFNTAGLTDPGVTYDVRVRAQVDGSFGAYSDICQLTSAAATKRGVSFISGSSITGSFAYPNPSNGNSVTLSFYEESAYSSTIEILNLNGQTVYSLNHDVVEGQNSVHIDFAYRLNGGVYFARVGSSIIKFTVQ